ncbi:MAG TPA: tetratricopeptide repeat protein [Terriglobales bacterium]|nr:tetratricopeptide repeat protein [Terriglobales bacterium]
MRRAFFLSFAFLLTLTWTCRAQDWVAVRSPNLQILTDGDAKSAQTALWRLEQVRTQFGLMMNRKKVNRNRSLLIVGVRDETELNTYAGGKATLPGGFAMTAPDRDYLFVDLSENDWSGIYRSYALLLLDANYPKTQPWFDEGMAETLAGLNATEKVASLGVPPEVARSLQAGSVLPVSQLIALNVQQSPEFRATAWLLFRWLQESNQLEAAGQYFQQVMVQHVAPEQAFAQTFSISPHDLDAALQKFRATAVEPKRIEVPNALDKGTFASNKLSGVDAAALKAEFRLEHPDQRDRALSALKQLLANNHDNAEVNRGLGIAYFWEGDLKAAADYIRRAIELDNSSAEMHYLLAVYYNQGSRGAVQVDSAAPTILLQTEKAVAIDPELSDAYALMAQAQVAMENPAKAAQSMQRALALRPRDESLLLQFADVQIANSRFADAKALLNFLKTSDNREVASRATAMLGSAEKERKSETHWANQAYTDPTAPQWKRPEDENAKASAVTDDGSEKAAPKVDSRKVEYLKGTLLNVQCSDKSATLKVASGKKTWTFSVPDRSKALLIGADNFQCGWRDVPVSVNFKASGNATGDIVSLEVD